MVEVVISQKQARALAQLIYRDIHKYCEDHREEYMQLVTERNIIEQAETVESMISELFATTE